MMKNSLGSLGWFGVCSLVAGVVLPHTTIFTCSAACVSAPSGLVSWWPGEGNGNDATGIHNGSLLNGVTFDSGEVGHAFRFVAGPNQRVYVPDSPSLQLTNSLTIEGWFKINGGWVLVHRGDDRPGFDPYSLSLQPNGTLAFQITDASNNIATAQTPGALATNIWTHLAATLDGATGMMSIYVNGQLSAQTQTTIRPFGPLDPTRDPSLCIGNVSGHTIDFPFDGWADEVSLYNRALVPSEIQSIYNAGAAGKCPLGSLACVTPPPGLAGWWPGEGNGNDALGTNNGVLMNGVGFGPGEVGQAFTFYGSNQFVAVADAPSLDPTNAFSLEAWVNLSAFSGNDSTVIAAKEDPYSTRQYQLAMFNSGGHWVFRPGVMVPGGFIGFNGTNAVQLNTWYHVVETYDGAVLKLYVNGNLDGSTAASGPINVTANPFRVGSDGSGPWNFIGNIDEVSLYNRALGPSEIQSIYNAGAAGKCPPGALACVTPPSGLAGWWAGEGNGNDVLGTNNGVLMNGVGFGPGEVGQAFTFYGSNQFVAVADAPSLDPTNAFSLEAWVNLSAFSGNDSTVIAAKEDPYSTRQYQLAMFNSGGHWVFRPGVMVPGGFIGFNGTNAVQLNTWYHVVETYDGAVLKLYVNGNLDGSTPASGPINVTANPFRIGSDGSGPWNFIGNIDEVSLYNRALVPSEIQSIYNAGAAGKCPPGALACVTPPSGLAGWWAGEGSGSDVLGANNGVLMNGAGFGPGEVGQAFTFYGSNQFVAVADAPSLDPTNAFSLEAWVNLSAFSGNDSTVIAAKEDPYSTRQYQLAMFNSGGHWIFRPGVMVPGGFIGFNGTNAVQLNTWYHVVETYDGAVLKLYVNGNLDGSTPASGPINVTANPFRIGSDGSGPWNFIGNIDEVSLYNRALVPSEIQSIYNAGAAGKCATPIPVAIYSQPANQTVVIGQTASFTVDASGTAPLSYKWSLNGTAIPGATNNPLVLTNVQAGQAGNYSVQVTNALGSATSSNALLTVNFAPASVLISGQTLGSGGSVTLPVLLVANGNENALGFSLAFSPGLLCTCNLELGTGGGWRDFGCQHQPGRQSPDWRFDLDARQLDLCTGHSRRG